MGTAGRARLGFCGGLMLMFWSMFWASLAQAAWLPINPDELAMTSEPNAPQASAIYLYRQVDRDDDLGVVKVYNRIKILTEEGRDQANIKIVYDKQNEYVRDIEARTIQKNGSVIEFDGKPFDQLIAKGQGVNVSAKVLTLTNVQVGSIIEYRYSISLDDRFVFDSSWVLNDDLFIKRAKFSLVPNGWLTMRWSWPLGLPPGTKVPEKHGGSITMETANVPAFIEEKYMPPESVVKMRVEFIYMDAELSDKEVDKFWTHFGKIKFKKVDNFVDDSSSIRKAALAAVSDKDSPEVKARKLYELVQNLRNTTYEREQTDVEIKREGRKENHDADDVLKHGYGQGDEINLLYVAMARVVGLEAYPVLVARRDHYFFKKEAMNPRQLNTYVVQLKINGKDVYVDPGVARAPFGLLPWVETVTTGLRLDKDGGSWVTTPLPPAQQSVIERDATLQMDASGNLSGKLRLTFRGSPALAMRLSNRLDDDTERKKTLEKLVKSYIPIGSEATLTNKPEWNGSASNLLAEFDLDIPGWMQSAGSRGLFAASLFGGEIKHDFDHATREYAVYYSYPFAVVDDVVVKLPAEWQVDTLPPMQHQDQQNVVYTAWVDQESATLHMHRKFVQNNVIVPVKSYDELRNVYQQAQAGDEQQVVLVHPATATKNNKH